MELIFAITVMGVLFGLATTVVIGMIRFYTFANTVRTNQQEARSIMNSIANDATDGQVAIITRNNNDNISTVLCIKNTREIITYELDETNLNRKSYNAGPKDSCNAIEDISSKIKSNTRMNNERMLVYFFDTDLLSQGAGGDGLTIINTNVTSLILRIKFATIFNGGQNSDSFGRCEPADIYCSTLELNTAVKVVTDDR